MAVATIYKVITISDIVEWNSRSEIKLNPKYQRNTVWNDKTRSYLMDTIVRGMPIPPIFIRQSIDVLAKITYREVLDGQQRLRTIIDFVENKFSISKSHNQELGGKMFSALPFDIQEEILGYQIFVVIINEKDDNVVYDMFARLNTNNYVLNRQEIRNSKYWGEFKIAAYNFAAKFRSFFSDYSIFSDKNFSRMDDVEFISSIMNLIMNGITTETQRTIDKLYEDNNKFFEKSILVEERISYLFNLLSLVFSRLNSNNYFTSKVPLYTLCACLLNLEFGGILDCDESNYKRMDDLIASVDVLSEIINDFNNDVFQCLYLHDTIHPLFNQINEFDRLHSRRTTSKQERSKRVGFLYDYLIKGLINAL